MQKKTILARKVFWWVKSLVKKKLVGENFFFVKDNCCKKKIWTHLLEDNLFFGKNSFFCEILFWWIEFLGHYCHNCNYCHFYHYCHYCHYLRSVTSNAAPNPLHPPLCLFFNPSLITLLKNLKGQTGTSILVRTTWN